MSSQRSKQSGSAPAHSRNRDAKSALGPGPAPTNDREPSSPEKTQRASSPGRRSTEKTSDTGKKGQSKQSSQRRKPRSPKRPSGERTKPPDIGGSPYSDLTKSFLTDLGIQLTSVKKEIDMRPLTDSFMQIVDQAYNQLIDAVPSATEALTRAQWAHCHRLMFARRIEDIRFDAHGIKPAAPVRVPLPKPLRVFQPIWDMLACLGITTQDECSAVYVPLHPLPESNDPTRWSDEYLRGILCCTAFDWTSSWEQAQINLDHVHREGGDDAPPVPPAPERPTVEAIRAQMQQITQLTQQMQALEVVHQAVYPNQPLFVSDNGDLGFLPPVINGGAPVDGQFMIHTANFWPQGLPRSARDAVRTAQDWKAAQQQWRPQQPTDIPPIRFDVDVGDDIGAYGAYLGWSPYLWVKYQRFVGYTENVAMYSLSMPNETTGTMAWVVQHYSEHGRDFCKLPTRSIAPADWVLATLTRYASWETYNRRQYISTWYTETDRLGTRDLVIIKWLKAAIKRPAPVIPTYL